MKNKNAIAAVITLVVLAIVAAACWFAFRPQTNEGSKNIVVQVLHKDGSEKEFEITTTEEYLCDAMMQEGLISGQTREYGMFVLEVDGEEAIEAENEWWLYTKDGQYVEYGVDQCVISDGDHYEFYVYFG